LGAHLQCLYANTCSMGNKQEELETWTSLQDYDLIDITEVGWGFEKPGLEEGVLAHCRGAGTR